MILSPFRQGVFERADELAAAWHEQVVFCRDNASGLKAIISIHDTTLGPALGGTRFYPYVTEAEALRDSLRLSQGMTFKNAAAGLPLGGGKAVIIGDPTTAKTPALLRAYGRFVERLNGIYVTAADVGTNSDDLDIVRQATSHVVGCNVTAGGSGDSGRSTARGVFHAMRTAAQFIWGPEGLRGRTVGVEGLGKVGRVLVDLLRRDGATLVVTDPSEDAVRRVAAEHGDAVRVVGSLAGVAMNVYAPCALGATLTAESVGALQASLVCGAANNQLATADIDTLLFKRGITWVPDYVANAGGVIQVGGERLGRTLEQVKQDVNGVGDTTHMTPPASCSLSPPASPKPTAKHSPEARNADANPPAAPIRYGKPVGPDPDPCAPGPAADSRDRHSGHPRHGEPLVGTPAARPGGSTAPCPGRRAAWTSG